MGLSVVVSVGVESAGVVSMTPRDRQKHCAGIERRLKAALPEAELIGVVLEVASCGVVIEIDNGATPLPWKTSEAVLKAVTPSKRSRGA